MTKNILFVIFAVILLTATGCSSGADSSKAPITSVTVSSKTSVADTSEPQKETEIFEAEIIGYDGDILTYQYDGEIRTSKMSPELFSKDTYTKGQKQLSQQIINNRYGIRVKGIIILKDNGKVASCDVISLNGSSFESSELAESGTPFEQTLMDMNQKNGSIYEFSNEFGCLTANLNDLNNISKGEFGKSVKGVCFGGYRFKSGELILEHIDIFDHEEKVGNRSEYFYDNKQNNEKYSFFGRISSLTEGRAKVLLNDGKTVCDIPTYYNDGELSEGLEVMVTLDAEPSLFGSGKEYKSEFAVFYTDPEVYNYRHFDFGTLAYAKHSDSDITKFIYTQTDDLK